MPERIIISPELQIALIAALVGALIGGSFALLGILLQHFLYLREDRIKRERREIEEQRKQLTAEMRDIYMIKDMYSGLRSNAEFLVNETEELRRMYEGLSSNDE